MTNTKQAAVLVPFYRSEPDQLRLVLIERTRRGRHAGQIALPGGNSEPGDESLRATAIRETSEELGLPTGQIEIVAELPPAHTATTGYQVWPFVARLHEVSPEFPWRPQPSEVNAVLDVPVTDLTDSAAGEQELTFPGWSEPRRVRVRYLGDRLVWGLTLRILEPVLEKALSGAWPL